MDGLSVAETSIFIEVDITLRFLRRSRISYRQFLNDILSTSLT